MADLTLFVTTLFEQLKRFMPEAMPIRYGEVEPLQHRLTLGDAGEHQFVQRLVQEGSLSWTGRPPAHEGSITRSGDGLSRVSLSFDARPFELDAKSADSIAALLLAVARATNAVYAAAMVERNHVLGRTLSAGAYSESYPMPWLVRWRGLSPVPAWLTWYGEPYASLLLPHLPTDIVESFPEGMLVRLGREPLDLDECLRLGPVLPARYLMSLGDQTRRVGRDYRDDSPAKVIPRIT